MGSKTPSGKHQTANKELVAKNLGRCERGALAPLSFIRILHWQRQTAPFLALPHSLKNVRIGGK